MAGPAEQLAQEAPSVLSAETINTDGLVHYYHGELESIPRRVRIFAVAPDVTDQSVHDAFSRAASAWYNTHTHPNVVTVHEHGTDPRPWIAVEFIDGDRLETVRDELSVPAVRRLIEDAADALRNAALYNTTHLSLSPNTVWVVETEDGLKPRLDDWGLERACQVAAGGVPTTAYTAPELQDDPEAESEQADVYSLGAVTYFALAGHPPDGPAKPAGSGPVPVSAATDHPEIDESVDEVIQTALAKEPDDRYDSAYAFQTATNRVLPTTPYVPDTPDTPDTSDEEDTDEESDETAAGGGEDGETTETDSDDEQSSSRAPTRRAVLGLLGLGTVGGAGWYFSRSETATDQAATPTGQSSQSDLEVWTSDTGSDVSSSPAVVDGTLYVGSNNSRVYALDATDGTQLWTYDTGAPVGSSPAVVDGTCYVGSQDTNVYALDATDGTQLWTHDTGSDVRSSPAVVDGTLYVGSSDTNVYALDATDGTELWTYDTGDWVQSSPAVVDGTCYVGSGDNTVYALTEA